MSPYLPVIASCCIVFGALSLVAWALLIAAPAGRDEREEDERREV